MFNTFVVAGTYHYGHFWSKKCCQMAKNLFTAPPQPPFLELFPKEIIWVPTLFGHELKWIRHPSFPCNVYLSDVLSRLCMVLSLLACLWIILRFVGLASSSRSTRSPISSVPGSPCPGSWGKVFLHNHHDHHIQDHEEKFTFIIVHNHHVQDQEEKLQCLI